MLLLRVSLTNFLSNQCLLIIMYVIKLGQSEEGWMDEDPLIRDIPLPSVLLGGVTFTPEDAERQWMEFMSHLECPICHEGIIFCCTYHHSYYIYVLLLSIVIALL